MSTAEMITPDFGLVLKRDPTAAKKEMLRIEVTESGHTIVWINSSSLSILQSCPRKSYYLLERNLRSRVESPPLVFGNAIHKALELFYSLPREDREMPPDFADEAARLVHNIADLENPETLHPLYAAVAAFAQAAKPLQMLPDTDKRSLGSGAWLLSHYFKTYLNDEFTIYKDASGPITERTFRMKLVETEGLAIMLFGTIDFVLWNARTGEILPGDHKTSSQMGSEFMNRIKPNHQYTGYLLGAREVLGLDCEKFLVNGIQVKPKPLTARGTPPNFLRQITVRNETDFAEFRTVVLEAVQNFLRWKSTNIWPLGPVDACAMWGGCNFLDVCSAPTALRENIIEGKYA